MAAHLLAPEDEGDAGILTCLQPLVEPPALPERGLQLLAVGSVLDGVRTLALVPRQCGTTRPPVEAGVVGAASLVGRGRTPAVWGHAGGDAHEAGRVGHHEGRPGLHLEFVVATSLTLPALVQTLVDVDHEDLDVIGAELPLKIGLPPGHADLGGHHP